MRIIPLIINGGDTTSIITDIEERYPYIKVVVSMLDSVIDKYKTEGTNLNNCQSKETNFYRCAYVYKYILGIRQHTLVDKNYIDWINSDLHELINNADSSIHNNKYSRNIKDFLINTSTNSSGVYNLLYLERPELYIV